MIGTAQLPLTIIRATRWEGNPSTRGRREPPIYEIIDDNPTRNNSRLPNVSHNIIDIVDLTNNTS